MTLFAYDFDQFLKQMTASCWEFRALWQWIFLREYQWSAWCLILWSSSVGVILVFHWQRQPLIVYDFGWYSNRLAFSGADFSRVQNYQLNKKRGTKVPTTRCLIFLLVQMKYSYFEPFFWRFCSFSFNSPPFRLHWFCIQLQGCDAVPKLPQDWEGTMALCYWLPFTSWV